MVRRFFLLFIIVLFFSSCAFWGSSMFPTAVSEQMEWFFNDGNISRFYILKNNNGEEYLFVVKDDSSIAIFDTSLNLRGFLEDGNNGASTDGVGFVDIDGNFIVGQTEIMSTGETTTVGFAPVPDKSSNSFVCRWTDNGTDYYIKIKNDGDISIYNSGWGIPLFGPSPLLNGENLCVNQSDPDQSNLTLYSMTNQLYIYSKADLFALNLGSSTSLSLSNTDLTQWITECSRGYFISNYSGEFILFDNNGGVIKTIENRRNTNRQMVTIDYDCSYYYYIDEESGRIIKEKFPL